MVIEICITVAGWLVSAVVCKVVNLVSEAIDEQCNELKSTQTLLNELKFKLPLILELLDVAANKPTLDQPLSAWIKQVRNVVYDADDLLDEFEPDQVSKSSFSISKWFRSDSRVSRLKKVVLDFNNIAENISNFVNLLKQKGDESKGEVAKRNETTSLMNHDEKLFGREDEINLIKDILMTSQGSLKRQKVKEESSNSSSRKELIVLPIVGIGGIGKTTLAKAIYNDVMVKEHFDLCAWIYVCDSYDDRRIMFDIIQLLSREYNIKGFSSRSSSSEYNINDSVSLEQMSTTFIDITSDKTFFLVLDDVSEKFIDKQYWETLGNVLRQRRNGSAVLVTTQSVLVSDKMGNMGPINLDVLSEPDYWDLFKYYAFADGNISLINKKILENIGREISTKLNGLPLAARVIGRLLNSNLNEEFWSRISKNEWWEHKEVVNRILPSLGLSYQQLSTNLKQCFAYCSIFPSNYLFKKHQIVEMWIAQGYIQPSGGRRVEDVGNEYFDELAKKSFFIFAMNDWYVMHDLLLDLARLVSRDECFVMKNDSTNPPETVRHLAITAISADVIKKACSCKRLRTLLVFGDWKNYLNNGSLNQIVEQLKKLRVLDLFYAFEEKLRLPYTIGDLLHLRYLAVRGYGTICLDSSICNLFHLQVFNVDGCRIENLPTRIHKLVSLRHLYVDNKTIEKISRIGKLTNLQELTAFTVKKQHGYRILELKEMNQLHGHLSITSLENVQNKEEALSANIMKKEYLRHLSFSSSNSDERRDEVIFEGLQPNQSLRELDINGYAGIKLPSWMLEIQNLTNLRSVCIAKCEKLQFLPPLGQLPYLNCLSLENLNSIKCISHEFYGKDSNSFTCLEEIKLDFLKNLIQWDECSDRQRSSCFSSLQILDISSCKELKKLPNLALFSSLKTLRIVKCSHIQETSFSIGNLTAALENLSLVECSQPTSLDGIESLVNLKRITVLKCHIVASASELKKMQPRQALSSLTILTMDDSMLTRDESVLLPSLPSLKTLIIDSITSKWFGTEQGNWLEQLRSLKVIEFKNCLNLKWLPANLEILPIRKLTINNCPSIVSLPKNLPSSLQELHIYNCSTLQVRCSEVGIDWPKIKHIPFINIQPPKYTIDVDVGLHF